MRVYDGPFTIEGAGDAARTTILNLGGAILFRPYGTRGWRDTEVPTTEVVGYFLLSLGDSIRTRGQSRFLSSLRDSWLERRRIRTGTCPRRRWTANASLARNRGVQIHPRPPSAATPASGGHKQHRVNLSSAALLSAVPAGLVIGGMRSGGSPVAIDIRHLRCRLGDAADVGGTGCIRGVDYSNVAWAGPSTMSTRRQECGRGACAAREITPGRHPH